MIASSETSAAFGSAAEAGGGALSIRTIEYELDNVTALVDK